MPSDERPATAVEDDVEAADEAPSVEQDADELAGRIEELEQEVAELTDKLARTRAELQNTLRERSKEMNEANTRGKVALLKVLGELTDDLDRAIEAAENEPAILTGLELVKRRIETAFENNDVEVDDPIGEPFDPRRHEAVMREETDEADDGTIIEVFQKGLVIGERVVRPALVKVAVEPSDDGE